MIKPPVRSQVDFLKIPRWAIWLFAIGNILAIVGILVVIFTMPSGWLITALGLAMAATGLHKAESVVKGD